MKFGFLRRPSNPLPVWLEVCLVSFSCVLFVIVVSLILGQESSYFDEGFTSYIARFSPLEIAHYTSLDVHPPLYYIVLHYWQQLVGINVFSLRLLSILFAAVAIVFAYLIGRSVGGVKAGLSVLVIVALSPLFMRYSGAMRMYSMAIAIVTIATYVLMLLHARGKTLAWKWWIVYGLCVAAGMWTNYFTALVWLAHAVWLFDGWQGDRHPRNRRFIVRWFQVIGGAVVLYLPWLPSLVTRFSDVQSTGFWIKPMSVDTVVSTLTTAFVYKDASNTTGWLAVLTIAGIALAGYVIVSAYRHIDSKQKSYFKLLCYTAATPIVALAVLSLPPFKPSFVFRYVLAGVFMGMIVLGISLASLHFRHHGLQKKRIVYAVLISTLFAGIYNLAQAGDRSLDTGVKNMVAQAMTRIHASSAPGEPIVSRSPYTYYTAALYETVNQPVYYVKTESLSQIGSTHALYDHPDRRGIPNLTAFARNYSRIWIIAEDKASSQTPPAAGWKLGQSFTLHDPVTGVETSYGSEYVKL